MWLSLCGRMSSKAVKERWIGEAKGMDWAIGLLWKLSALAEVSLRGFGIYAREKRAEIEGEKWVSGASIRRN